MIHLNIFAIRLQRFNIEAVFADKQAFDSAFPTPALSVSGLMGIISACPEYKHPSM